MSRFCYVHQPLLVWLLPDGWNMYRRPVYSVGVAVQVILRGWVRRSYKGSVTKSKEERIY